ncbi:hypothetical protein [Gemmatimonas sp.]|uniref:hypothetical protein n=1 Tax=Gemmatimonas sp. TaxID=1962908 RepID=UPI003568F083
MPRNQKDETPDTDTILKAAGLIASSAAVATILDLGTGRVDGRVIVNVTAIEVATGDERYLIKTQFSAVPAMGSVVFGGTALDLGDSSVTNSSADSIVGTYELPFCNEINGTLHRYMRLYTSVQGTIATGINYSAYAVKKA